MEVIPAINCPDFQCVQDKVRTSEKLFPFGGGWVHLDVTDGRFTYNKTWDDPHGWGRLKTGLKLEVHLMVEDPEIVAEDWLKAGAKRIIVHLESLNGEDLVVELCRAYDAEVMLAISPETPAESLRLYFKKFVEFQVLAVIPGLAGQAFLPTSLDKVRFLRTYAANAKIEVDGGINLETGQQARDAGADILISASYIFGSDSPVRTFNALKEIE